MADDIAPTDGPGAAPDERDERIGALLAVEPLDDVTRRRLVNTAIRSTGTAKQARRLVAAAAVVVVLVGGAGVMVAVRGGDSTSSTAARDKIAAVAPANGATAIKIQDGARDLGEFGDLGIAANVDRLRSARANTDSSFPAPTPLAAGAATVAPKSTESDALITRFRALGCSRSLLPTGTVVALASGMLGGHPVIVLDIQGAEGMQTFHAIETDTCKVHRLS